MSNAPAWLRCENCLWFRSLGCTWAPGFNEKVSTLSSKDRCKDWRCKRCLSNWWEHDDVNHLYCKIVGLKKPSKNKEKSDD